ncbi:MULTISPECIES: LON peptidase substrate-binding domain-containing protein [Acidithrix]|uniref:ATP-dependent protease La (LON) domain protein n=1 Tax=Acidithrix ferrooxidans TaxID=1280514 RepID=A0A0D8HDH8_9ACTN|nr:MULTISPECIES: LON peptidase substrate-binding domain-containing protein [Acidithrix]KJF15939.1 ATP-dependent protease La (LON) domain protein [Acidithrix ferrooxidans]CAG4930646.1 unnamed protein product [Acidithrix sp. C25]
MIFDTPSGVFIIPLILFPGESLTIRVFEPRYHQLIRDCDRNDGCFVIADTDNDKVTIPLQEESPFYATRVRIVSSGLLTTGDRIVEVVGDERISVKNWLPDDPYPVALIRSANDMDLPDLVRLGELENYLKHAIRLAIEMGAKVNIFDSSELPTDPTMRLWALCAKTPLHKDQRHELLVEPFGSNRLETLGGFVAEQIEFYEKMLGIR